MNIDHARRVEGGWKVNLSATLLIAIVSALIGYRYGWERAHVVVAKECKTLGGFYVAGETFKCSLVEPRKNNE